MVSAETETMCFACGKDNPISLGLDFKLISNNKVKAEFTPGALHQGYNEIMHGGLTATLLDEAMVKVINFKGIKAFTAEMNLRYRHPVPIGEKLIICGQLIQQKSRLYVTEAQLKDSQGKILVQAKAKFMEVD